MVNIMKIRFIKMGINGEGIGYLDRKPVFCDGVLPGETAEVEITEDNGRFIRAKLRKIIERSEDRVRPLCPYQRECGGCALMCLKKEKHKEYKKQLLEEALYKYGNVKRHFVRQVHEGETFTGFRNQLKLPVREIDGRLVSGMYKTGTNHFLAVDECAVHDPLLEKTRKEVLDVLNRHGLKAYDKKTKSGIRCLVMRVMDEKVQCTLITGHDKFTASCVEDLMKTEHLVSLFQSVNTETKGSAFFDSKTVLLAGEKTLALETNGIRLQLSPQSFFQLNREQAEKMYAMAVSKVDPCGLLVEAYCGIGAMSLMAAKKADRVIGIEYIRDAIDNAKQNAELNGIANCEFLCADAAEGLYKAARKQPVDCLLADPPRSGMDENMIAAILKVLPKKIIYISCNPATLAKNLKDLKKSYQVQTVIPYDLFPFTPHVESITVLTRNG